MRACFADRGPRTASSITAATELRAGVRWMHGGGQKGRAV
jgi:hypothetical protein